MKGELIIQGNRLRETIREQLQQALSMEAVRASIETEFYLVNLLSDVHDAGHLQSVHESEKPLAQSFLEAMQEPSASRALQLKGIGDATLVTLGFFAESIRRSIMGTSYYLAIGNAAYDELAAINSCDPQFAAIYAELAAKFAELTEVLAHLAPWNRALTDAELVNLYRRWLATGDEHLAEQLRQAGIISDETAH